MAEKPVTEKLEKMQIKVADAEQRRTQLEVDLQNIKNKKMNRESFFIK